MSAACWAADGGGSSSSGYSAGPRAAEEEKVSCKIDRESLGSSRAVKGSAREMGCIDCLSEMERGLSEVIES